MDVTPVENSRQCKFENFISFMGKVYRFCNLNVSFQFISTDIPCCGHSRSPICRETCKNILEIGETMQEIIDTLSKGGCEC